MQLQAASGLHALSALLAEAPAAINQLSSSLKDAEVETLCTFEAEGRRLLASLSDDTLKMLEAVNNQSNGNAKDKDNSAYNGNRSSQRIRTMETEAVKKIFSRYDSNEDGFLSKAELRSVLKRLNGNSIADKEVDDMMNVADTNADGKIDVQEFIKWIFSTEDNSAGKIAADLQRSLENREAELDKTRVALKAREKEFEAMEEQYKEEADAVLSFWKSVAASSATKVLSSIVDLDTKELLGYGNYGFVFKCKRLEAAGDVVVKLMSDRWAHVAVKEWQHGSFAGKHPNIVDYEQVMLHADDDNDIKEFLVLGYESGKIQSKKKRTKFPDHYLCLIEEFMDRGTVQHWIDKKKLTPGNLLAVTRDVAVALAFMHEHGLTHNDIKPENILLTTQDGDGITIKLADLGLANKTDDRSNDFSQFGMTLWCMATGVTFGERKFDTGITDDLVSELEKMIEASEVDQALSKVPDLLRNIWGHKFTMKEISKLDWLQDSKFEDHDARDSQMSSPTVPITPRPPHTPRARPSTPRARPSIPRARPSTPGLKVLEPEPKVIDAETTDLKAPLSPVHLPRILDSCTNMLSKQSPQKTCKSPVKRKDSSCSNKSPSKCQRSSSRRHAESGLSASPIKCGQTPRRQAKTPECMLQSRFGLDN